MPCYKPGRGIQAPNGALTYYGNIQVATGKCPTKLPPNYLQFPLPCGRCIGCKLERSRQWAVRLMHEAQLHERTCFVTLTYKDASLPNTAARLQSQRAAVRQYRCRTVKPSRTRETRTHVALPEAASLSKNDLRKFTQALNSHVRRTFGVGVRYFACGEYGDKTHRPHYHIAIYGEDFSGDRTHWKTAESGSTLWRSPRLASLWPHGDADIGDLTFESAAYIARYITKKITGTKAQNHYKRTNKEGKEYWLEPEFNVMSRRPGLAKEWFLQFNKDVYPHDHVISRGYKAKPPRYYDKLLEALAPFEHEQLKAARKAAPHNEDDQTNARLEARETVALAQLNQNKRSLE